MSDACCRVPAPDPSISPRFRRALWIALAVNASMFVVEVAGGLHAGSVSLLADAVDFAGDAANYGLSLAVLSMGALWRSRAALVKGASMGIYGVAVLGVAAFMALRGTPPEAVTMGVIGFIALVANVSVAALLYAFREGDANMRSVWLCSRNDAISNVAVMGAALGVFGTGSAWPDLAVAAIMATLALTSAVAVVRQARGEIAGAAVEALPRAVTRDAGGA
jgi:Co/Zn/Cd efflux system component